MKYAEKLLDPRWQKIRLEILARDEWECKNCFDSENTLTVHHLSYSVGKDPWDYPLENFLTLCKICHENEFTMRPELERELLQAIRQKGFMADDLPRIIRAFQNITIRYATEVTASMVEFALSDMGIDETDPLFWKDTHLKAEKIKEVQIGMV